VIRDSAIAAKAQCTIYLPDGRIDAALWVR